MSMLLWVLTHAYLLIQASFDNFKYTTSLLKRSQYAWGGQLFGATIYTQSMPAIVLSSGRKRY